MKRFLLYIFAGAFLLTGAIWLKTQHNPSPKGPASSKKSSGQTRLLRLPGAQPIAVPNGNIHSASHLWTVVNKEHTLEPLSYVPQDLAIPAVSTRTDKSQAEQTISAQAIPSLEAMFRDAKVAGYDLMLASGYRSYELQKYYFESYTSQYGLEAASKFSARPGQSEHQTGLAFDVSLSSQECYLEVCFGNTAAGKWLASNAPKYGFILRYPADKTEVTKYQYEPWHFRYVGTPLAQALVESKLTLDEAYPYLQKIR